MSNTPRTVSPTRRRLLQGGALAALAGWVWVAPRLGDLGATDEFMPIRDAQPFRWLAERGPVSSTPLGLLGLDAPDRPAPVPVDLCRDLFRGAPQPAIAYFTDANCPNCPRMEARLTTLAADRGLPLLRHELPLRGPGSETAAALRLAMEAAGATPAQIAAVLSIPGPQTPPFLLARAAEAGVPLTVADLSAAPIRRQLAVSASLARRLGIPGTPGTVIGRTVVIGTLPRNRIARIIDRTDNLPQECAAP